MRVPQGSTCEVCTSSGCPRSRKYDRYGGLLVFLAEDGIAAEGSGCNQVMDLFLGMPR